MIDPVRFSIQNSLYGVDDVSRLVASLVDLERFVRASDPDWADKIQVTRTLLSQMAWHIWGAEWKDRKRT